MSIKNIIVKIGGKILEDSESIESTISQLKGILHRNSLISKIIIIPGGGSYANFIRKIDIVLNIGDNLAHWMAILAMDYNGIELNKKFSDIEKISDFEQLEKVLSEDNKNRIFIFGPFEYLYNNDPLPHSWEVTSDSITLYIASKLKLKECFLIKNIDGIFIKGQKEAIQEISIRDYERLKRENKFAEFTNNSNNFKKSQPIDPYLLELIDKFKIPCIILNGTKTNRILDYFHHSRKKKKIFTIIKSD